MFALLAPRQTSGLWDCEAVHLCSVKPPGQWGFVRGSDQGTTAPFRSLEALPEESGTRRLGPQQT